MAQAAQKSAIKSEKEAIQAERAAQAKREREFTEKLHERKRKEAIERAALTWNREDFSPLKGHAGSDAKARKNRHDALRRVIELCRPIAPERIRSFTADFCAWDRGEEHFRRNCGGGNAYPWHFAQNLNKLVAALEGGNQAGVAAWWEREMSKTAVGLRIGALPLPALPEPATGQK
jgi:hypothetical protein